LRMMSERGSRMVEAQPFHTMGYKCSWIFN
jgi:hypothetical protein